MVKVSSKADVDAAYAASIGTVPAKYKAGVQRTNDTIQKGVAAEGLYAQRTQEAISSGRRAKALASVSEQDWQNAAAGKGAARIGEGMNAGKEKRSRNFEPYRQAIADTTLPERTADPMTNVTNRVGGMVKALVDKKKEIKG